MRSRFAAMSTSLKKRLSEELSEDLRTAWAPDVADNLELDEYAAADPKIQVAQQQEVAVPRPNGSIARVGVLHPRLHWALHEATSPLRNAADEVLAPGVSGYRRGAEAGSGYSEAYRRMRDLFDEFAESARVVVFADVERFFGSVTPETLRKAVGKSVTGADLGALFELVERMTDAGLPALTPGYADARLIGNLVLHQADRAVPVPFTRWVDDYRLFVPTEQDVPAVVRALNEALASLGLRLNAGKTLVLAVDEARRVARDSLGSVYHPDRDTPERVRSNLRAVLTEATKKPVTERRALRFVLPRLAREQDDVAVPFALRTLRELPWDAPRAVAYLGHFLDQPKVPIELEAIIRTAANRRDSWLLARLSPLAVRISLNAATLDALTRALPHTMGSPAWGLMLRLLALNGRMGVVQVVTNGPNVDVRAVLTAYKDLGLEPPQDLAATEPVLAEALESAPAPLPASDSLL